jgi:threonyl-tRNA synthetase
VGKKIREAVGMKVPVVVVVGPRDVEGKVVSLRVREGERTVGIDDLEMVLREM